MKLKYKCLSSRWITKNQPMLILFFMVESAERSMENPWTYSFCSVTAISNALGFL